MSKRPLLFLVMAVILTLQATFSFSSVGTTYADDQPMRLLSLPDLGSFEYPLATYSVHADMMELQNDRVSEILFPGAFTIAPNDAFVYRQLDLGNTVYTVRIAPVLPSTSVKTEELPKLLGALPLIAYDQADLSGVAIQSVTIDGFPAVRADNFMVGAEKVATHIIVKVGATVMEIVVLPTKLTGSPMHNTFMAGNENANRSIYEAIIASLRIHV
ncbi:MAG: hypothetical protein KF716_32700 [Anaerolineae bacterium]|nr:hypothetical protein [Anaerolineae bacterium]